MVHRSLEKKTILRNENNTIKEKRRMRANVNMNISLITGKKI